MVRGSDRFLRRFRSTRAAREVPSRYYMCAVSYLQKESTRHRIGIVSEGEKGVPRSTFLFEEGPWKSLPGPNPFPQNATEPKEWLFSGSGHMINANGSTKEAWKGTWRALGIGLSQATPRLRHRNLGRKKKTDDARTARWDSSPRNPPPHPSILITRRLAVTRDGRGADDDPTTSLSSSSLPALLQTNDGLDKKTAHHQRVVVPERHRHKEQGPISPLCKGP